MASLGIAKDAKPNLSKEQKRDMAQQAYQEKADQHFMSVHAQKGVNCISCHDPKAVKDVAWMATSANRLFVRTARTAIPFRLK